MSSKERVNEPPDTFRPVIWVPGVRRQLRILSQPPLSVVSASATVSDIDSVLNFCVSFVTCLLLCVLLSVAAILPLYQLQIDASCCLLSVADSGSVCFLSLFFSPLPPPSLFSGLDCFQEPHGVMPDLSLSVQLSMCVSSCLCLVHFFPIHLHRSSSMHLQQPSSLSQMF